MLSRILLLVALAPALVHVVVTGLAADPAYNPSVALQTIGGADMTKPAARDNPVPVELQNLPALALVRVNAAPALKAVAVALVSTPVLADGGPWRWRFVQPTDASTGVWCQFGAAAVKAAPSFYVAPREKITWGGTGDFVPAGVLACISDGIGPVALTAGQVAQ